MRAGGDCFLADGPGGESPAEIRHRTLMELRKTVRHHPAVDLAIGVADDAGRFQELEVVFDAHILGVDVESASLRIEGRPRFEPSKAYFVVHYDGSTGREVGWYREPNPDVDRLEHRQERDSSDVEYEYEPTHFESQSPVALLWGILGRIEERL